MLIDPRHPFYRPLWRRVLIVAVPLGWAAVEVSAGAPFWGMLFAAIGFYALWVLVLRFPRDEDGA